MNAPLKPPLLPLTTRLDELPDDAFPNANDGTVSCWHDLRGSDQHDTRIHGWLLLSNALDGRGGRYTEMRLYESTGGTYIAAVGNRSDNPGEMSFWTTAECVTIGDVLDAWRWTMQARRIAKEQGWETRRIYA